MQHGRMNTAGAHAIGAAAGGYVVKSNACPGVAFWPLRAGGSGVALVSFLALRPLWAGGSGVALFPLLTLWPLQARCSINVERGNIVHNIAITHHP